MHLKSIQLAGFKSFVDPTRIPIRGNLSAVVGPNGCGKSNIVDAIRWVIGETSAKQLRGQSMSDVIFNGTTNRKPVSKASIELLFDNSDGRAGGAYARYTEIAVRREIEREGPSTYFINGIPVRRRDVVDLFLGTGLGPRSYAIIEQGMISHVIEAKPEELRVYIEEAAGISKYKERRRETENRMRHTQENLDRLNDIREELTKQLNHLKRQANAAERYKLYQQEERLLNAQIKSLQWKGLEQQLSEQDQLIHEQNLLHEEKQTKLQHVETEMEKIRDQLLKADEDREAVQKHYYALGADIARLEQRIKDTQEQTQQWESEREEAQKLLEELQTETFECDEQITHLTTEIAQLKPKTQTIQATVNTADQALTQAEEKMTACQTSFENFQNQISQTNSQVEVTRTKREHYQQEFQHLSQQLQQLQENLKQFSLDQLRTEMIPLSDDAETLNKKILDAQEKLQNCSNAAAAQRQMNQNAQESLQNYQRECQILEARYASLEALQKTALGTADEEAVEPGLKRFPRLGQMLQVQAGFERAVEMVLNQYFNTVCVEEVQTFLERLAIQSSDSVTLLEKATAIPAHHQEITLADQVKSEWPLRQWLGSIYIAKTTAEAQKRRLTLQDHESVITEDGLWMGRHWVRIYKPLDHQHSFLLRQQQLKQLQQEIHTQQGLLKEKETQQKEGEKTLQRLESERDTLYHLYQELSAQQTTVQSHLSVKKTHLVNREREQNQLQQAVAECMQKQQQIKQLLLESETALQQLEILQQQQSSQREELQRARDQYLEHLKVCRTLASQAHKQSDELYVRLAAHEDQLTLLKQTMTRAHRQIEQLEERNKRLTENLSEVGAPIIAIRQELQAQLQQRLTVEIQLQEAEKRLENIRGNLRALESERSDLHQLQNDMQKKLETLRLQRQAITIRQTTIQEQLNEADFDLTQVLAQIPLDTTLEVCQQQLEKIIERLQRLGAINLAAIEEHAEVNTRKSYLDQQHADLTEALSLLQDAIKKIDRETRAKFQETYHRLNQQFQLLFPRIFGGGQASLEMTEDDLLAAGVIVRAHPPGKRNVTIHLLSGGEKALTAIALLFALFQLNPAPFCILDEVDAPLDDINVSRFCQLVKEMAREIQFIVISHNKVTIEMANHLMGVTMQEAGVSRLVSVDMQEAIAMTIANGG